jgi:hypothetical protein
MWTGLALAMRQATVTPLGSTRECHDADRESSTKKLRFRDQMPSSGACGGSTTNCHGEENLTNQAVDGCSGSQPGDPWRETDRRNPLNTP